MPALLWRASRDLFEDLVRRLVGNMFPGTEVRPWTSSASSSIFLASARDDLW